MQFETEQRLREQAALIPLGWAQTKTSPFAGATKDEYRDVIEAAHIVSDEARLALHRWVDAGRRMGMSWTELGSVLGISKQAAQQRFRTSAEPGNTTDGALIEIRLGATAFNEMRMLEDEGRRGNELVRTGMLSLVFRRSEQQWEYQRVVAVTGGGAEAQMSQAGWTYVSSWFPFHYFKRVSLESS